MASRRVLYNSGGGLLSPVGANQLTGTEVTWVETNSLDGDWIYDETPSGAINGSNVTFTLANTPISGTLNFKYNGVTLTEGASDDYTISGVTITMDFAPLTNDKVFAKSYRT